MTARCAVMPILEYRHYNTQDSSGTACCSWPSSDPFRLKWARIGVPPRCGGEGGILAIVVVCIARSPWSLVMGEACDAPLFPAWALLSCVFGGFFNTVV